MDPSIRGRVLNRIAQTNKQVTAGIGPGFASALISQAPTAIMGAAAGQNEAFRVGAQGEADALNAAATRAAGISSAASSVAGAAGGALGRWSAQKESTPPTPPPNSGPPPATRGSWYQRYFG